MLIVIKFFLKIRQAIYLTTHHSLPSFPIHLACLPIDLSWHINYVYNKFGILAINQKSPKDITEGILLVIRGAKYIKQLQ